MRPLVLQLTPISHILQFNKPTIVPEQHLTPILPHTETSDPRPSTYGPQTNPHIHVPLLDRFVLGRRVHVPVHVRLDLLDRTLVALERVHRLGLKGGPHLDRAVLTARQDEPAVLREGHREDWACVFFLGQQLSA